MRTAYSTFGRQHLPELYLERSPSITRVPDAGSLLYRQPYAFSGADPDYGDTDSGHHDVRLPDLTVYSYKTRRNGGKPLRTHPTIVLH